MEELLQWLCAIHPLTPKCLGHLRRIIRTRKMKKNELLLRPGEICSDIYFIKNGVLRCYYIRNKVEVTDWLFSEGDTVVSIDSFYDQVPGKDYIQALEDCELYSITFAEFEMLFKRYLRFNVIGCVLYKKYLRIWHAQARNIRMLTAEERYQVLLEERPDLIKRVALKHLASYLDMSKETLSRMRRRLN